MAGFAATNRYVVRSRISEASFRWFLRCVAADLTGVEIAQLIGLNRNTVNRLLACLRERMAEACELERPFCGTIEFDESYFGPRRVKGKAGRGAAKKTPVFEIFKRDGKVYTNVVPDCSKAVLQAAIRGKVSLGSVIHSDGWRGYDGLVDMGYKKHLRVDHSKNEFSSRRVRGNHLNGIEGFWGYAKSRMARFRGMHPDTFLFHLKECEFRFTIVARTSTRSCSPSAETTPSASHDSQVIAELPLEFSTYSYPTRFPVPRVDELRSCDDP